MALKLIISQKELSRKLKAVNSVIKPKNFIPILDNILLDSNEGLHLIASSDSSLIKASVTTIECDGAISVCIPAKTLLSAIRELPDQPLEINVDDDLNITVRYQSGHFEIKGITADEYPVMTIDEGTKLTIDCAGFVYNIKKARNFCANDELRPVLNGVFFEFRTSGITYAASDSTKLCLLESKMTLSTSASAIISSGDAKLIADVFDQKQDITIEVSNSCSKYSCGDYELISKNIEGRYPNFRGVIPKSQPLQFQLNKNDLISAIRRVSLFSSDTNKLVVCQFGKELRIESRDIDYAVGAEESVQIEIISGNAKIGFNANMILDVLSSISTDSVTIHITDERKAGVFQGVGNDDELYLLMPIMIQ